VEHLDTSSRVTVLDNLSSIHIHILQIYRRGSCDCYHTFWILWKGSDWVIKSNIKSVFCPTDINFHISVERIWNHTLFLQCKRSSTNRLRRLFQVNVQ
jgi:hypothetical protein